LNLRISLASFPRVWKREKPSGQALKRRRGALYLISALLSPALEDISMQQRADVKELEEPSHSKLYLTITNIC
jgi:hypothetical protein